MNNFTEDPHVRVLLSHRRQHRSPELRIDGIGGVQPPAVNTATAPIVHDPGDMFPHCGVVVVECDQVTMTLENVEVPLTPANHTAGV